MMFSESSESKSNSDSFFTSPDPNSKNRAANAFVKCLNYVNSIEGTSYTTSASRSFYKNIEAAQVKRRSYSKRSDFHPRSSDEDTLALRREIKHLACKLKEKDIEIKDLTLQVQEKEKENIELATSYEIEIEALKRELVLMVKNNDVNIREQLQKLELEHSKEKRTLRQKISALENSIVVSSPAHVINECQDLEDAFTVLENYCCSVMNSQNDHIFLCDLIIKEISRLNFFVYQNSNAEDNSKEARVCSLKGKLELILELVQDILAIMHSEYLNNN